MSSRGAFPSGFPPPSAREGVCLVPAADLAGTPATPTCRLQRLAPSANSRSIIARDSHLIIVVFHTKDDANAERNLPLPTLTVLRVATENEASGVSHSSYN